MGETSAAVTTRLNRDSLSGKTRDPPYECRRRNLRSPVAQKNERRRRTRLA